MPRARPTCWVVAESKAQRLKIIEKLNKKTLGTKCHLKTSTKIINNKLFLSQIKRPLENFHEIFGLVVTMLLNQPRRKFSVQVKENTMLDQESRFAPIMIHRSILNLTTFDYLFQDLFFSFHFIYNYHNTSYCLINT
jgi:hypothetical protein